MQKKKAKNPQPDLFSILDNGDIATNNPIEESDKVNETQEPLPYVVKTQINTAKMISRNPIEWARYLSFERRVHKDNSKEDVNFFANGEIKESSRVYEANEEGFERCITKRYDLIDTTRNREFFSKEIDTLTYTNSLEELKEQGLEIQLTHHHEMHKKTLENGNEIAKEYDYLKDIYQEVERTKDNELVREIIPSISSAEYFKLYNKPPFESINNENTKLNTNDNEEVKKLEFELAKEVHALILEQQLLSATNYYSWIDKDDYASFAWKMHRLINENKLKENHLSADNANKIKQFFFNNGFILGWTKEEQSAMQENRDYSLKSALLSLEEIAQAKIELQKYYESVYINGDGSKREIKPFKEILRDINNFEKAYKERYNELVNLNEAIIQAKEGSNGQQNSNANNNNIIQNNDNNNPNLSIADLELEQQNLGEQNGKERTNRADEPNKTRQEFRKKFTAEANMEDCKREWSDRVMKNFHTKTLVYLLSLESREEQEEFIDLATNRQFQKNPIESEIEYMNMYLEEMEYQQERMQEQIAMEHQIKQAEWKMEQEAKKRGIIPAMREEYHRHRNPHLINKIAPEIWGFLSLENSQDRLDAYAFLIMDRWAHYFPQTMKTKEKATIMSLIEAVIEQTKMETKALDRMEAQIKRAQGVSDMELLKEAQINQYYHLLKADYIMQDSAHQMDLETLKKTGIKREDFYQI
ncbi:hypothetical protein VN1230_10500 [Helicobacter pylori]|nr:hypothetical protein VN1230_10500 [Helicobacter pylori]